ncbi:MAG: transporter substrate-binding domain-containing protein [Tissierellia bacterium]|nr:transporter substrate-binding domain-containing protein [Tissierellia bacterium]
MKKQKWILGLVLVLVLSLTLTACGKKEEPKEDVAENAGETVVEQDNEKEDAGEPAGDDNSLQNVLDKGKLVVATSADYPPYEFIAIIDGKDEIVGFDISMVKYIAEELGVELELQNMDFDNVLMAIPSGKVDMAIAGLSADPTRDMEFSDIYYEATHSILVTKDNVDKYASIDDLQGKLIGAQLGTTQEKILGGMDGVDAKILTDVRNIVMELKTNKLDGVMMETPVAQSYELGNEDLVVVPTIVIQDLSEGTAIGFKTGNLALRDKVNEILAKIKDEDLMSGWVAEANAIVEEQGL